MAPIHLKAAQGTPVAKLIVQPGVVLVLAHFLVDGACALFEHCQHSGLSKHKSPECIQFVDELPRNSTGKVLKTELRERFCRRQTEEKP